MESKKVTIHYNGVSIEGNTMDEAKNKLVEVFPEAKTAHVFEVGDKTYVAQNIHGVKGARILRIKCNAKKDYFTVEACLKCARGIPPCNFTYSILKTMYEEYVPEEGKIHVTELWGCARQVALKRKLSETVAPEDLWFVVRGKMFHSIMETVGEKEKDILTEYRMSAPFKIHGKTYSLIGRLDEFDINSGILRDYKTTTQIPRYSRAYADHGTQVNTYAYLLERDGKYKVNKMEIIYADLDSVKKIEVLKQPRESVEADILYRLKIIDKAFRNIKKSEFELGWRCSYCPEEIYLECRSMIITKLAKKAKKKKLSPEEVREYLRKNFAERI